MVTRYSLISRVERSIAKKMRGLLICTILLFGCSPASPSPTVVLASETPLPSPSATPTAAPDYVKLIRNAEYQLGLTDALRVVQFTDGIYRQGTAGEVDYVYAGVTDFVAAGDLNGDGSEEVATLVAENYGGSGTFVFLAIYGKTNGRLIFQTSTFVDDRPLLNTLTIENGEIFLDSVTHDSDDPFCCPTLGTNRHYRLTAAGQLEMTDYATFTPDDRPRAITIDFPENGAEVFSNVQVRGHVTIAPFENNLVYRIYSTGDVELAAGSITVTADELGGPGTFDSIIALGNILSGAVIRIEIQDVSAEDSSLFAMDSVELVVK